MASLQQRLPENVPGDFFVDSTCIDCDTCSQLAPAIFRDHGDQCSVHHQPETSDETRQAMMALVACPTGSIRHSQEFEGASYNPAGLVRHFVTEPTPLYKPKKGGETDPKLAAKADTGQKYLGEFATPDGGGAAEEA